MEEDFYKKLKEVKEGQIIPEEESKTPSSSQKIIKVILVTIELLSGIGMLLVGVLNLIDTIRFWRSPHREAFIDNLWAGVILTVLGIIAITLANGLSKMKKLAWAGSVAMFGLGLLVAFYIIKEVGQSPVSSGLFFLILTFYIPLLILLFRIRNICDR